MATLFREKVVILAERRGTTNEVLRTASNESGYYALLAMPIGTYHITATASGFKKAVRNGLELRVGDNVQLDLRLEVGRC